MSGKDSVTKFEIIEFIVIEENKFKSIDEIMQKFINLSDDFPYINVNGEVTDFINGTNLINISAVFIVVRALLKLIKKMEVALRELDAKDDKNNRKNILLVSFKLAAGFDFLYAAMISDSQDIFWRRKRSKYVTRMLRRYVYEAPVDVEGHHEQTVARLEAFDYMVAVASKGLSSNSIFMQIFNMLRFAFKYKNNKKDTSNQAKFFMTVFREDTILRMMRFSELDFVKAQAK